MSIHKETAGIIPQIADADARTQCAALCYRIRKGKVQILVITTRRTKRWIIPKGWIEEGMTPSQCAAQEAWEEAGVVGKISNKSVGLFCYTKVAEKKGEVDAPCVAMIFPLKVKSLRGKYPEKGQRRRRWVSRKKAFSLIREPELAQIVKKFNPL